VIRTASAAAILAALAGCAPVAPPRPPDPTTAAWRSALDRLAALRRRVAAPRTERIAVDLREPRTGRTLSARGAVALAPPRALRMILVGPGGTTALDLWMDGGAFRFAVPAIDLRKRGDFGAPRAERRGLPVDFLGWWLLRPLDGELLFHAREVRGDRFVLRDGAAVIDLRAGDDGAVEARRTTWSGGERLDEETIDAAALGCGEARYRQRSTGLEVRVRCEGETLGMPAARALADPDAEGS
jgi:hypothetical protein